MNFLLELAEQLRPHYTPPSIGGGHDCTHVERLAAMGLKIKDALKLDFCPDEFFAAVWLHNLDRSSSLRETIGAKSREWLRDHAKEFETDETLRAGDEEDIKRLVYLRGLEMTARNFLENGPFDDLACERIVDAVLQHNKKDDEPGDSPLLTALRVADKLDRFGALGVFAIAAFRGNNLLPYDSNQPFGYASTAEDKLKTLYNDCFRVLEWYGMLPSDDARSLVNMRRLRFYIQFLHMLGEEIAEATGNDNLVDDDVRKALGTYYHEVLGIESSPEIMDETMGMPLRKGGPQPIDLYKKY